MIDFTTGGLCYKYSFVFTLGTTGGLCYKRSFVFTLGVSAGVLSY